MNITFILHHMGAQLGMTWHSAVLSGKKCVNAVLKYQATHTSVVWFIYRLLV